MLKRSKTGNSCRYPRDRAISLASEEGLCSGNSVKAQDGLVDGAAETGTGGQAK